VLFKSRGGAFGVQGENASVCARWTESGGEGDFIFGWLLVIYLETVQSGRKGGGGGVSGGLRQVCGSLN
jgi:hypothetical protein